MVPGIKIHPAHLITLLLSTMGKEKQLHTISQFKSAHGIFAPVVKCIDNLKLLKNTFAVPYLKCCLNLSPNFFLIFFFLEDQTFFYTRVLILTRTLLGKSLLKVMVMP